MTLYNEIEPYAAAWMRNLIAAGHVADGIVDERSIADLRADDLAGHRQAHFFAGLAGWSYALRLAGWPDDLEVWTGSCPCQPFSTAGKQRGFADDRHLWPVWFELIRECRPTIVFGEQVAGPAGRAWLDAVSADLESAGYAVGAANLCAAGVGAPHIRQRLYFVAVADADHAGSQGRRERRYGAGEWPAGAGGVAGAVADAGGERFDGERVQLRGRGQDEASAQAAGRGGAGGGMGHANSESGGRDSRAVFGAEISGPVRQVDHGSWPASDDIDPWRGAEWIACTDGKSRQAQPGVHPLAHGVPCRVGRLRAYGNAIVPQVAAAWIGAVMDELAIARAS